MRRTPLKARASARKCWDSLGPVSYTHLDVYKRQDEERDEFLDREPGAAKYMHPFLGSREFINGNPRTILYLGDVTDSDLDGLPLCKERVELVRQFRLASSSKPTQKLAERPTHYHVENMPKGNSVLIPEDVYKRQLKHRGR